MEAVDENNSCLDSTPTEEKSDTFENQQTAEAACEQVETLSERFNEDEQVKILKKEKDLLKKKMEEKEEMIRKLKMVKMYRNKVSVYFLFLESKNFID